MKNFLVKNGQVLFVLGLFLLAIIIFIFNNPYNRSGFSGGSGVSAKPILIIKGWHKTNQFGTTIGSAITTEQTNYISQVILADLKADKKDVEAEISGKITGYYQKNKIDQNIFYLKTKKPAKKYKIKIDYLADSVEVYYQDQKIDL